MAYILIFMAGLLSGLSGMRESYFNKPYSVTVEEITEDDLEDCQADANCMDILQVSDTEGVVDIGESEHD